jgi:hypothetical protein
MAAKPVLLREGCSKPFGILAQTALLSAVLPSTTQLFIENGFNVVYGCF